MKTLMYTLRLSMLMLLFSVAGIQCICAQTAYAVLDNFKLTFYYDDEIGDKTGSIYTISTSSSAHFGWTSDSYRAVVSTVEFKPSFRLFKPTSTFKWFSGMEELKNIIGIKYLNTSEVVDMRNMFASCKSLESLDLSNFDTRKVSDMDYMFYECRNISEFDLSNFNTSSLKDTKYMFSYCTSAKSIKFGKEFTTSKVTDMNFMFFLCSELTNLDLTMFDTRNVVNMEWMFSDSKKLKTIEVGDNWSTAKVKSSDNMFDDCSALVGGSGTAYDPSHKDATYAHIDGGTSNPGYLTKCADYDLWVGGVRVNKSNCFCIPVQAGSAEYDPDENVLWLKKTNITSSSSSYAISSSIEGLTIHLLGNNILQGKYAMMLNASTHIIGDKLTANTQYGFIFANQLTFDNTFTYLNLTLDGAYAFQGWGEYDMASALKFGPSTTFLAVGGGQTLKGVTSLTMESPTNYIADPSYTLSFSPTQQTVLVDGSPLAGGIAIGQTYPVWFGTVQASSLTMALLGDQTFRFAYDDDGTLVMSGKPGIYNLDSFRSEAASLRIELEDDWHVTSSDADKAAMTLCGFTVITGRGKLEVESEGSGIKLNRLDFSTDAIDLTFEKLNFEVKAKMNGIEGYRQSSFTTRYYSTVTFNGCNGVVHGDNYSLANYNTLALNQCRIVNGVTPGNHDIAASEVIIARDKSPYAVLDEEGTTLTFYYDGELPSGTVYELIFDYSKPGWLVQGVMEKIRKVVFDPSFADVRPNSTYAWFQMERLTTIEGIEYLNTSEVKVMGVMFLGAKSLETLDLSHFDTRKVINMREMFYDCSLLKTVYVGDQWSTDAVDLSRDDMYRDMFTNCTHIVGGMGTTCDDNYVDVKRAHVDYGAQGPGYFTYKASAKTGDVNEDGSVNINDVVAVINVMAGTANWRYANVNGDSANKVDINDVVSIINIMAGH